MTIAVIGGGAAGFFAALAAKENHPGAKVTIFEQSGRLLAKVKVSGGGRCNVTHNSPNIKALCAAYPRGGRQLKKPFGIFGVGEVFDWFGSRGVALKVEADGRVFPVSDSSQSVIDCLLGEARRLDVGIEQQARVLSIAPVGNGLQLEFGGRSVQHRVFDKVIVATGGSPRKRGLEWLEKLGHKIESPVPSLFTFNMPDEPITQLMGVSVENAMVGIQGSKLSCQGALLITHWGMSGPAILKLSAFGARMLAEADYNFTVKVNWAGLRNEGELREGLAGFTKSGKTLGNSKPFKLPERLWHYLLQKTGVLPQKKWRELSKKEHNRLVNVLANDEYAAKGKTTFKEEFVTCGGVSLDSVDMRSMKSKVCPNLYFAGEVLDIDAVTGGYNFQAAWTTAYIAAKLG